MSLSPLWLKEREIKGEGRKSFLSVFLTSEQIMPIHLFRVISDLYSVDITQGKTGDLLSPPEELDCVSDSLRILLKQYCSEHSVVRYRCVQLNVAQGNRDVKFIKI